jgi:hypothetical protein
MLIDFTSYEEIRAALGVSDEELEDATLALPMYEQDLIIDLDEIHENIDTEYHDLAGTLSNDQLRFQRCVQVFSTYSVARHLLNSLPMFAPKRMQDGRAEQERSDDPYEATRIGVNGMYGRLRAKLAEAFETLFPGEEAVASIYPTFATSTGLPLDPVTNT